MSKPRLGGSFGRRAVVLAIGVAILAACGGESSTRSSDQVATTIPTTTPVTTPTTTSLAPTTTTTVPTTTTTPTGSVTIEIAVYDDLPSGTLEIGAPCDVSAGDFSFVRSNTGVILEDPNSEQTLAVARVGSGRVEHEFGISSDLPSEAYDLFWYCSFVGAFEEVPLDRDFYKMTVDGDTIVTEGLTYDGDQVKSDRYLSIGYFYTDNESLRDTHRQAP